MKVRASLLVLVLLATLALSVSDAQNKRDSASKVLAVEKEWNEVYKRGDIAMMNSLLTDDVIITVEDGQTYSMPGYIAHSRNSSEHVQVSDLYDMPVRMHVNDAVVIGGYRG